MEFITVPNCRLGEEYAYPETINVESIVSFQNGKIDLSNRQFIITKEKVCKELREYLIKKGHTITKLGD